MVYPGCLSLFRVLDRGCSGNSRSCNLVFLSARPHLYKNISEECSYVKFEQLVESGGMHSFPTLLPGRLSKGVGAAIKTAWLKTRAWQEVGELKYDSYQKFAALYQEYDF